MTQMIDAVWKDTNENSRNVVIRLEDCGVVVSVKDGSGNTRVGRARILVVDNTLSVDVALADGRTMGSVLLPLSA